MAPSGEIQAMFGAGSSDSEQGAAACGRLAVWRCCEVVAARRALAARMLSTPLLPLMRCPLVVVLLLPLLMLTGMLFIPWLQPAPLPCKMLLWLWVLSLAVVLLIWELSPLW